MIYYTSLTFVFTTIMVYLSLLERSCIRYMVSGA